MVTKGWCDKQRVGAINKGLASVKFCSSFSLHFSITIV